MIRSEFTRSAWKAGALVESVEGQQLVKMTRIVPRWLHLRCQSCGATWTIKVSKKARCKQGWRRCPRLCNAMRIRKANRGAAA